MSLAKAMATVGGLTLVSRITGFIRDILTAAFLGAGPVADAFFVALKFPNFFRRITGEGAFSFAFVPLYTKTHEKEGTEKAEKLANQAFTTMLVFLIPFTLLALLAMPWVLRFLAPGFEVGSERYEAALEMTRITFPYLLMMSITSLIGGMLNAHNRFAPFASMPILFNITLIGALLLFHDSFQTVGHAMSWAVAGAGIIQVFWIYCFLKKAGLSLSLVKNFWTHRVKKLFSLMAPAAFGAGVTQINLFIDIILASFLQVGAISFLYYADRLNQLPLGVVGIAIGTALLPMLSRALSGNNKTEADNLFNRSVEFSLLLALPATLALILIPTEMITVLFERGSFGAHESKQTIMALQAYAIGLPAYILVKVFNTVFFSREDTKTPVKISVVVTIINIALSIVLIQFIDHVGIALATGIVGWIHIVSLFVVARKKRYADFDKRLEGNIIKILLSVALMGGALVFAKEMLAYLVFADDTVSQITGLILLIASGCIVYGSSVLAFGVVDYKTFRSYIKKKPVTKKAD